MTSFCDLNLKCTRAVPEVRFSFSEDLTSLYIKYILHILESEDINIILTHRLMLPRHVFLSRDIA